MPGRWTGHRSVFPRTGSVLWSKELECLPAVGTGKVCELTSARVEPATTGWMSLEMIQIHTGDLIDSCAGRMKPVGNKIAALPRKPVRARRKPIGPKIGPPSKPG